MKNKAVFLDRDGVINRNAAEGDYIYSPQTFELLPDVDKAIATIHQHGYMAVVITNQRGIEHGVYTAADVENTHAYCQSLLNKTAEKIDAFYYCPDSGPNRKPNPGMLIQAANDHNLEIFNSYLVGDRDSDIQAGLNAGIPRANCFKMETNGSLFQVISKIFQDKY